MNTLGIAAQYQYWNTPEAEWVRPIDLAPEDRAVLGKYYVRTILAGSGNYRLRVAHSEQLFAGPEWKYVLIEISEDYWSATFRGFLPFADAQKAMDQPGVFQYSDDVCYLDQEMLLDIPFPKRVS